MTKVFFVFFENALCDRLEFHEVMEKKGSVAKETPMSATTSHMAAAPPTQADAHTPNNEVIRAFNYFHDFSLELKLDSWKILCLQITCCKERNVDLEC